MAINTAKIESDEVLLNYPEKIDPEKELGKPETQDRGGNIYNVYHREILYGEVWRFPVVQVAKKYNVSDVTIHKVCKSLNIPTPPKGYWEKVRAGERVKQTPLPKDAKVEKIGRQSQHVELTPTSPEDVLDFLDRDERATVLAAASQIHLISKNGKLSDKIIAHRQTLLVWDKEKKAGRHRYGTAGKSPFLYLGISPDSRPRAYRIIDTLLRTMEPLGCSITDDLQFFIVRGQKVAIGIDEYRDKITHVLTKEEQRVLTEYQASQKKHIHEKPPNICKYDHIYNGKLKFIVDKKEYYHSENEKSFRDDKNGTLEEKLGDIIIALYEVSEILRKKQVAYEEEQRKYQEEEAQREIRRKRYKDEVQRTNALVNEAENYDIACKLRAYIAAVESAEKLNPDKLAWVNWAKQKADWYDPTVALKDEILGIRNHEDDAGNI